METMFNTLLQLPLFQGLCHEDFTCILDKVKFHFIRHKAGDTIIEKGAPCEQLCFLLKGEVSIVTSSADGTYTFIEPVEAPFLFEAYALFGLHPSYVSTYVAQSAVHTITISKAFVLSELFNYEIFRFNYMNIVSSRAQVLHSRLWNKVPMLDSRSKVIHFILSHCERPQGEKIIKIRKEDLARCLDDTYANTSKALHELQGSGLIELRRKEILIPDAQLLRKCD